MGSEDLLRKAIIKTYQIHKPKQIIVLTGCSTVLIQEDYEAVAYEVEQNIGIPVIYVSTGGIVGDLYYGYKSFLEVVVEKCRLKKDLKSSFLKKHK